MRTCLKVRPYDLELLGERTREIKQGELAHKALYLLPPLPKKASKAQVAKLVETALLQAVALADPHLKEDLSALVPYLKALLTEALSLPEVRPFFEEGLEVYQELEIQDENGELHRLDRLIMTEEGPVILEFKLGGRQKSHLEQVRLYQRLIQKIYNVNPRAYLLYLEEPNLIEVGRPIQLSLF